ncbi:MAG TPA: hypothetical protein VMS17_08840 [Gemmataceae bacterium]|nr:hypothetical protein [Gemmataceae bacterium]
MTDPRWEFRAGILQAFGASGPVIEELLAFGAVARRPPHEAPSLPLPAEAHVEVWREYAAQAAKTGAWNALRPRLPQLQFPVRAGISGAPDYLAATRRGEPPTGEGLAPRAPDALRLAIHDSLAGPVPVLSTADRGDFVLMVQALSCRNEPAPVPDSMGACLIAGFNNWDRIHRLQARCDPAAWPEEFQRIVPHKSLYQDRFLILFEGPYSSVSAADMGLPWHEWLRLSRVIRLAHECTHYLSLRLFGSTLAHPLDELIADYAGIAAACGRYRADWALRFLGLEDSASYRPGARLENYRGQPPLSDAAFGVLQRLLLAAAENLERFDSVHFSGPRLADDRATAAPLLFQATLEELASADYGRLPSKNSPTDVSPQ